MSRRHWPRHRSRTLAKSWSDIHTSSREGGGAAVLIAQALACNPDLLIADEPTTALDVTIQAKILKLDWRPATAAPHLRALHKPRPLARYAKISDRVAVMYAGRIAEIGRTDDVFRQPLRPPLHQEVFV